MAAIVRLFDSKEDKVVPKYSVDARAMMQTEPGRYRPASPEDERKVKAKRENLAAQSPSMASNVGVEREGAVRGGDLTESDPLE